MKHYLSKLLSALLIAALMLSPVALMEEEIEVTEPVDALVEEQSVDIVEEDTLGDDEVYTYAGEHYDAGQNMAASIPAGYLELNETNFPDAALRFSLFGGQTYVEGFGLLLDPTSITQLIIGVGGPSGECSSLKGIEYLTNLEEIWIDNMAYLGTTLDLSHNTKLKKVDVGWQANLTSVTVNSSELTDFSLGSFSGGPVDMPALTSLSLGGNDKEAKIVLDGLSSLSSVDFSGYPNLNSIHIRGCGVSSLDFSNYPKLTGVSASYCNSLTTVNVINAPNLQHLQIKGNPVLTTLNLVSLPALAELWCSENSSLPYLDVSNCPLIKAVAKPEYTGGDGTAYINGNVQLYVDSKTKIFNGTTTIEGGTQTVSATKTSTKLTAKVGTTYKLDLNGQTGTGFKSSNKKIATVNSKGIITPKAAGKCKITFKIGKKSYTVNLTVKDTTIPTKVTLNLKGTIAAKVGVPQTLTATMNDGAVSKLKWTSSNKKIATVNSKGVVKFKKKGTVTITVTTVKGNKKAKVKFKVSK